MKYLQKITVILIAFAFLGLNAQEKKIKFYKGTLKICSSKNFQIEGYDGDEVIIKSLHEKKGENSVYIVNGFRNNGTYSYSNSSKNKLARVGKAQSISISSSDSIVKGRLVFRSNNSERKKGLKKTGY